MKELPKIYEPQQVEGRVYQMWMDHDCFKAECPEWEHTETCNAGDKTCYSDTLVPGQAST